VTATEADGYDLLSGRLVPEDELRAFLLGCFEVTERELFVCHADRAADEVRRVPGDAMFAGFCTYYFQASGHFAMGVDIGIEGRLVDRVGRREFAERFAAHFDTYVLYGDTEPPGVWSVVLADRTYLWAGTEEDDDRTVVYVATAPIPGLPDVQVDEDLWQTR
jgi:hypothetical protein